MSFARQLVVSLFALACLLPGLPAAADSSGTVLITGANRGIGLALAARYAEAGYSVIGTARKPDDATRLRATAARVEQLDVASQASVDALAKRLADVSIDILINNAGITGHSAEDFADLDIDQLDTVLQVNTLGPLRVTQALLPNVEASGRKVVANISSMMGSMELNTWGCCLGYRASKAALNSLTRTLAVDHGKRGLIFVTLHPGYVQTDMNDGRGQITPTQSAEGLFKVITGLTAEDNGRFYDQTADRPADALVKPLFHSRPRKPPD
jgi:NAD(P)-dependent dehydrogenase (short-subunit alcohol dehydrogenase family)